MMAKSVMAKSTKLNSLAALPGAPVLLGAGRFFCRYEEHGGRPGHRPEAT
jgi:hypothetical protein